MSAAKSPTAKTRHPKQNGPTESLPPQKNAKLAGPKTESLHPQKPCKLTAPKTESLAPQKLLTEISLDSNAFQRAEDQWRSSPKDADKKKEETTAAEREARRLRKAARKAAKTARAAVKLAKVAKRAATEAAAKVQQLESTSDSPGRLVPSVSVQEESGGAQVNNMLESAVEISPSETTVTLGGDPSGPAAAMSRTGMRLRAVVDSTQSLTRMARGFGSTSPGVDISETAGEPAEIFDMLLEKISITKELLDGMDITTVMQRKQVVKLAELRGLLEDLLERTKKTGQGFEKKKAELLNIWAGNVGKKRAHSVEEAIKDYAEDGPEKEKCARIQRLLDGHLRVCGLYELKGNVASWVRVGV